MTNKQIQSILNKLNKGQYSKTIFKHQIGDNVEYAKVWTSINNREQNPFTFFFIKNENAYVGAVLDMYDDLHWYIAPCYRRKGFLTKALKNVILPYLFDVLKRPQQKISITEYQIGTFNYNNSLKIALNLGFRWSENNKLKITNAQFRKTFDKTKIVFNGLTENEIIKINNELEYIAKKLNQINAQLDNAFGRDIYDYTNSPLKIISEKVRFHKLVIQDIIEDYNNAKNES